MKKRLVVWMMALSLAVFLLPNPVRASSVVASGSCGAAENPGGEASVTWELDSEGQLTISGTGAIADYEGMSSTVDAYYRDSTPLRSYRDSILRVVVSDGITSIGNGFFCGLKNLASVSLPDSVASIGDYAFMKCVVLPSIDIPKSVTSIGSEAFYRCYALTSVSIPDNVTNIGSSAFEGCLALTSISIPKGVTSIAYCTFEFCTSLPSISIPDSVTYIGSNAFYGCVGLPSVTIPNSVTSIGAEAFANCSGLTSVTIPDSVTKIGANAFGNCDGLTSVTIGKGVTSSVGAFNGCSNLTNAVIADGATCIAESMFLGTGLTNVMIPDSVTRIEKKAFNGSTSLKSIILPSSVTYIGADAFNYESQKGVQSAFLSDVYYYGSQEQWNNIEFGESSYGYSDNFETVNIHYANSVVFDTNGINSTVTPNSKFVVNGLTYGKLPTPSRNGYSFDGWYTAPTGGIKVTSDSIVSATENHTLYAHWNPYSFTVTFNANGGTVSPTSKTVTNGKTYGDLPTATKSNNRFDGWFTAVSGGTQVTSNTTVNLTANQTLYAHWTYSPASYTVTFNANGGTVSTANKTVTNGSTYGTLPTPTWTGHAFSGWFTAANGGTQVSPSTTVNLTANQTLYAHWTYSPASYTISFNANGGTVSTAIKTVTNGSTYGTLPTPTWASHTFDGWFTAVNGGTQITSSVTVNLTGNQILYAHWTTIPHAEFTWNRDNWNFNNSSYQGYFSSGRMIDQINTSYRNVLARNLTNTEYDCIFDEDEGWIYDIWGGSCYGMTSLTLLSINGLLPYSNYQTGATSLYQLSYPKNDMNVSSLVTYYQLLQVKSVIQYQFRTVPNRTNKANIDQIISLLNSNEAVSIGFKKSGWGGHQILAYGYEYGSYTFNGVTYQGHIKICDPNSSIRYNSNYDIYFNTSSYRWIIPAYSYVPIDSASGAKFNYIGANVSDINCGGYLTANTNQTVSEFVARIDIAAASNNRSIVKVIESNGSYITKNNANDDIVEDESFIAGNEGSGMAGYNLYDSESSYRVTQNEPVNMELFMDYGTCRLKGSSRAGESIVFDKKGLVEVNSQSADYEISMTFNKGYPTDWFKIQVSGSSANNVSLEMCPDGYLLSGDNLENISVETSNRSDNANANFSTSYSSALIFEIDADTIGVSVDTDGNGTYETVIVDKSTQSSIDLPATIEDVRSNQAALNFTQNEPGKCVVAIYNTDGRMLTVGISDISANAGKVSIPYNSIELPDRYVVKIMLLNDGMIPLYKSLTETRMRG